MVYLFNHKRLGNLYPVLEVITHLQIYLKSRSTIINTYGGIYPNRTLSFEYMRPRLGHLTFVIGFFLIR